MDGTIPWFYDQLHLSLAPVAVANGDLEMIYLEKRRDFV